MPSTINASTSSGLVNTADTSGVLQLQTANTTALTIDASQNLTYVGALTGGTGVVNLGSGQFYKDASGNVGIGATPSAWGTLKPIQIGTAAFAGFSGRPYMIANSYFNGSTFVYQTNDFANFYAQQGGNHTFFNAPSGTAGTNATMTQAFVINNNGNVALQGANTTANGIGIAFPATQSASSDANTLDDYEEGTFTPNLTFAFNSVGLTYNNRGGRYTKIGDVVTVQIGMFLLSKGSSTGAAIITGLPFTVANPAGGFSSYGGIIYGQSGMGANGMPYAVPSENTTVVYLYYSNSGGETQLNNSTIATYFQMSFSYKAA